ncbi:unnamed protein product [Effrenium voratum]|uniref:EF-hand domain-containing protein n=1 Tax=Effrenium voratum TaxID=2562239 RepID=A0AA36I3E5_9DINO|nr:unnamed protein product [Effrenium voratum]
MPILPGALKEPGPDDEGAEGLEGFEGEATPSTARDLKALVADPAARRVAFPSSDLAKLPLVPPAPPEADDIRSTSKRSAGKPLEARTPPSGASSPSSSRSLRSRDASKSELRRRTTSKGKVQVIAVPEAVTVPDIPDSDDAISGLPGVRESHVREAFAQIDFDGNGFIGVSELRYLLTVLGEEPTDAELDEMLAIIGAEGDGQAAYEDFRILFEPKSSVLAEMLTMAPEPSEAGKDLADRDDEQSEQEEIPRLEAPPQQLGLLVKGAASFMQARIKKEDAGKKKASRARPKAAQRVPLIDSDWIVQQAQVRNAACFGGSWRLAACKSFAVTGAFTNVRLALLALGSLVCPDNLAPGVHLAHLAHLGCQVKCRLPEERRIRFFSQVPGDRIGEDVALEKQHEPRVDAEDEEAEGEQADGTLDPDLLAACIRNDTEAAKRLIEQGANPCCEDQRQWSPLIWAASHGNEDLTRLLIKHNAAEVYKYDETTKAKKKHSPLHWAAFKGHLKVLWLLMAPPQNLSHHERDAIGNTPLHQAAAGGNLECAKCLMAQGCDVLAKNDRGHTPFALCTDPEVQQLLQNAMNATACKASGKQFSSTVLRYLCSWSLDVFCEKEVTQTFVYEHPEASEKEKPVTWCNEVRATIQDLEHQLHQAMHLNQLETVTAALEAAADKPVDCKLVHQCNQLKEKLESEIQLGKAMQVLTITNLDEFDAVHEALSKAIDDAVAKKADPVRVQAAKTLRRKLLAEASLMRTVLGQQKTTVAHISMLQELLTAAKAENANEDLIVQASKLIAKLSSESEVQKRIAATAVLCEVDSFKEAEGREEMPDWSQDTEQFEEFHEDFKRVMENAERDQISEVLMMTALEQLDKIERLLVEKKQVEAELGLKAAKAAKKKGKK